MSVATHVQQVSILGVNLHNITRAETIEQMEQMITVGRPQMLCTPNADHLVRAQHDAAFRQVIARASLAVADGMAVIYASHILGTPLKENVGGRSLLPAFAQLSVAKGHRLFLLGGSSEDVARRAAARLCSDYPGVSIAGLYTPPHMLDFDQVETGRMLRAVNSAKSDVLFVCLGAPKQEKWIASNLHRLEVPVSVGIGIALDMLAGKVRQPPKWMTSVGLEWFYRTLQEPKRLGKRYLVDDSVFFWWVVQQRLGMRSAAG